MRNVSRTAREWIEFFKEVVVDFEVDCLVNKVCMYYDGYRDVLDDDYLFDVFYKFG